MDASDNILTAGVTLRRLIIDAIGMEGDHVFPVTTSVDMPLPFVTFFRSGVEEDTVKSLTGPRTGHYVVQVYASTWSESVKIASDISAALDAYFDETIKVCRLEDASENFDPSVPAYMQLLYFKVKI